MSTCRIVVVGSTNTDLTVTAASLPSPGETVLGGKLIQAGGGKGANQAVAAARAGADVVFLGKIGDDDFGRAALAALTEDGIDTAPTAVSPDAASGVALIMVDERGENMIAVASGANAELTAQDVQAAADTIRNADMVVMQLETPVAAMCAAARIASEADVPVLLNPAPAPPAGTLDSLLPLVTVLTPNEGEAAVLLGADCPAHGPESIAEALHHKTGCPIVMTLGSAGACICDAAGARCVPALKVEAKDTVGAGDCFTGALAVALSEGRTPDNATRFAIAAAALSVRVQGAQPSMPTRENIERMLQETPGE